jgi:hypothetical protein
MKMVSIATVSHFNRIALLILLLNVGCLVVFAGKTSSSESSSSEPTLKYQTIRPNDYDQQRQLMSSIDAIGSKIRNSKFHRDQRPVRDGGRNVLVGEAADRSYTRGLVDGDKTGKSGNKSKKSKASNSENDDAESEHSEGHAEKMDNNDADEEYNGEDDVDKVDKNADDADKNAADADQLDINLDDAVDDTGAVDKADDVDVADDAADDVDVADDAADDTDVDDNVNGKVRTVQLFHPKKSSGCMAYMDDLDVGAVQMVGCSVPKRSDGDSELFPIDHWEVLTVSHDLFILRHKLSQLCIPQNPENPDRSFDCFRYSGNGVAIADSINGLVNCSSGFAAWMGLEPETSALFMYNTDCLNATDPGHDVIAMSYKTNDGTDSNQTIVMWGEKVIMDLPGLVEFDFQSEWILLDV